MHVYLRITRNRPSAITVSSNSIIFFLLNSYSLLITKPYIIEQTLDYLKSDPCVCVRVDV
jgi:hypothetical protein